MITMSATNKGTDDAAIIDDVSSVVTGVENTDIEVFDKTDVEALYTSKPAAPGDIQVATENNSTTKTYANVSHGVYALYDDEAYVIAAVVVGEDAGSTSNFVYVTSSDANRERYSSADDEYTWTREVVLNGEETEISYVGDSLEEIGKADMDQGYWYYVRYYADGTVKDAKRVADGDNRYDVETSIQDAVTEVEADSEHVLLNNAKESGLTFANGTLYSDVDRSKGIWISPDVKVVRIQTVDGKDFDEIEYYEGRDGLEDALDDLNVSKTDDIYVSAIVEDGAAMVVVLNNTNDELTDEGSRPTGDTTVRDVNARTGRMELYVKDGSAADELDTDQIESYLESEGYTDIRHDAKNDTWTFSKGVSVWEDITIDQVQVYKVTVIVADNIKEDVEAEPDVEYVEADTHFNVTVTRKTGTFSAERNLTAYINYGESDETVVDTGTSTGFTGTKGGDVAMQIVSSMGVGDVTIVVK